MHICITWLHAFLLFCSHTCGLYTVSCFCVTGYISIFSVRRQAVADTVWVLLLHVCACHTFSLSLYILFFTALTTFLKLFCAFCPHAWYFLREVPRSRTTHKLMSVLFVIHVYVFREEKAAFSSMRKHYLSINIISILHTFMIYSLILFWYIFAFVCVWY